MSGNLLARIAALESQVAALRAQAGGGEQLSPNYLTITPSGLVGADFTGHVKAQGVDLPEAAGGLGFAAPSAVDWLDATATLQEFIQGIANGGYHILLTQAGPNLGANAAAIQLLSDGASSQIVIADAGSFNREIITSVGASDFLQLLSTQQLQLAFGATSVTFPGGSPFSNSVTITYGIGRTAQAVFLGGSATTGGTLCGFNYFNLTPTTFQVQARTLDGSSPALSVTAGFSWAAIG